MKKAELQMQETMLVIFIVTIIIGIALFTFYQIQLKSIEKSKVELEQSRNLILLETLPNSIELSYSNLGNEQNSIDTLKLLNSNSLNYGFKDISIKQVYPEINGEIICNKQSYPNCNKYVVYSKKLSKYNSLEVISVPVSLYFPYTDEYKSAVLEVKSYS